MDGAHLRVEGLRLVPTPVERPDGRARIPLWVVGAYPSELSMGRALRHDGVVAQYRGERAEQGISPQDAAWVTEHRAADAGPFDVVLHDALPTDRGAAAELLAAYEEAGVTWFVDALWDPSVATVDVQRARVRQGPPR